MEAQVALFVLQGKGVAERLLTAGHIHIVLVDAGQGAGTAGRALGRIKKQIFLHGAQPSFLTAQRVER